MSDKRILVAGIGNIFLGDDGFGVEAVRQLRDHDLPDSVEIVDYGMRSYDLAYALMDDYAAVILLDATQRGEPPGTLYVIELDTSQIDAPDSELVNAHSLNPALVLTMVRMLGGQPSALYLVGCEPETLETESIGLSDIVQSTIPDAIRMVQSLTAKLLTAQVQGEPSCTSLA